MNGTKRQVMCTLGLRFTDCSAINRGKEAGVTGYSGLENSLWNAKEQYPATLEGQSSLDYCKFRPEAVQARAGLGRQPAVRTGLCCPASCYQLKRQYTVVGTLFGVRQMWVQISDTPVVSFAICGKK